MELPLTHNLVEATFTLTLIFVTMAKKRKRDRRQQQQTGDSTGAAVATKESNDAESSLSTKSTAEATPAAAAAAAPATTSNAVTQAPCREHSRLYTSAITYQCATQNVCIPCAYKICTFDVALDTAFTKMVPNARPESCPRSSTTSASECGLDGTMGYQRGMSVLTVGDGDLTFSLAVARILFANSGKEASQQHRNSSRLVATSYESRDTLLKVYPNIGGTIQELESLGATVCYQADATNIAGTLLEAVLKSPSNKRFDRITWNFPCSAIGSGQDGQNDAMEFNKQLIRDFVRNSIASELLDEDGGEIHMLHKTKPPFNQWQIESVALEGLDGKGKGVGKNELEYKGRIAFDRCLLPPYVPRKALDKKSFTCHDACTYVFGWKGEGDERFGCTIPFGGGGKNEGTGQEDGRWPEPLLAVTKGMIARIRQIHLDAKMIKMAATAAGRDGKGGGDKKRRRK